MAGYPPLAAQLRAWSRPLAPVDTGLPPRGGPLSNIRGVVFDLYGTLFASAAGDLANHHTDGCVGAFHANLRAAGTRFPSGPDPAAALTAAIHAEHARLRAMGNAYPEIDIRAIWRGILPAGTSTAKIETIALAWECAANPVWPMPNLGPTLRCLREAGVLLGIASNAQFFTPLLFEAFLDAPPSSLGFHPDLCRWSFLEGTAKPGPRLFELVAAALPPLGLLPNNILFLGNDRRNDVVPAAAVGFQTALFAGDARSLRLRDQPPPATVVTDLAAIPALIGLSR
jgi:putative hydrolase of the HAD superfamily